MKYPPVVTTLQEWLDGKLGIQGIDAVTCAFYVLSLLQRNETERNETETVFQLPCSKIADNNFSCWPQNSSSSWGYSSVEDPVTAKHLSAPVQGYEIEHLGNNLSPSLRSISTDGGDAVTHECLFGKQCFSLPVADKVKRYHEVFSVHGQPDEDDVWNVPSVEECKNTVWTNERSCASFFKHNLFGAGHEEKNTSFLMTENMIQEKSDDLWKTDKGEIGDRNNLLVQDKLVSGKKDVGCFFSWNTADDMSPYVQNSCAKEKCSEEMPDMWELGIFCKQVKSSAPVSMPQIGAGIKYIAHNVSGNAEDDSNLAQLIAKFDHSVEAIWNLGNTDDTPKTMIEQENLPWSFHNFLSPSQNVSNVDINNFGNNVESISSENSFIHSGTNLISSIWSDQSFVNKFDSKTSELKLSDTEVDNSSVSNEQSDLCYKLKVLLSEEELLQNEYNLLDCNLATSDPQMEALKSDHIQEVPEDSHNVVWNKAQTFPSLFSNTNCQEQFCLLEKLQDADSGTQDGNSCMINFSPCSLSHYENNYQETLNDASDNEKSNFSTLNHNREDSSFTEVLPRYTGEKRSQETKVTNLHVNQLNLSKADQSPDKSVSIDEKGKEEEEEEDLLTSARTHFRPIQQESQETHNNPTCSYADGTTFVISSNFSEVPFKRSESGTLYLENDDVCDTPKKYMEYKDKRATDQWKCIRSISKDTLENNEAFIPKFCVRQVEKCCQTDESVENLDELNSKKLKLDCAQKERNFDLFSSGDEIVKSVTNYLDNDNKIKLEDNEDIDKLEDCRLEDVLRNEKNDSMSKSLEREMYIWNRASCKCNSHFQFSSKNDSHKAFGTSFVSEKELWEPASATRLCQSRYSIWSCSPGPQTEPCPTCESLTQDKMMQYSQLREELSEDGEQLLSDLSSLQPLQPSAAAGWLDDALEQGVWPAETATALPTRVSSRRRFVSWGQFGEG